MKKVAVYMAMRNYYPLMAAAAKSLIANSTVDEVWFLIEDDKFPGRLPGMIKTINIAETMKRFPENGPNRNTPFTIMGLARACYCSLFPDEDLILQLDVDTVCVDNVDGIWDTDLTGMWAAMVQESQTWYRPYGGDRDPEHRYWNAGVALKNLKQMREEDAERKIVDALNTEPLRYVEQDALNWIGHFRITDLPLRYNESVVTGFTDDPAIIHYAGFNDWMVPGTKAPKAEAFMPYRKTTWKEVMKRHEDLTGRTDV